MNSPNQEFDLGGIEVTPSNLLNQANIWDDSATVIGHIALEADRSRCLCDPGIFGQAVIPYNQACDFISGLCQKGQSEMSKIADALRISHDVYLKTEQEITSKILRLGI